MTRRIAVLALVFAAVLAAQGNTRSVQGTVSNAEGKPVDQAVVQLKDTKSLAVRSFITRQDGTYHFHGLSTDVDYELRAEREGASSGTKTLSSFDSRKQAQVDLKLNRK